MAAVKKAIETPSVRLLGVDCHIGSQIHEVTPFVKAAEVMMDFIADIKSETGYQIEELDLGGGYGIRYTEDDDPVPYAEYMEAVSAAIHKKAAELDVRVPFILMEPDGVLSARPVLRCTRSGQSRRFPVFGRMFR